MYYFPFIIIHVKKRNTGSVLTVHIHIRKRGKKAESRTVYMGRTNKDICSEWHRINQVALSKSQTLRGKRKKGLDFSVITHLINTLITQIPSLLLG